ncbi:hypothetical protein Peur_017518 [Populus x canadensis]
MSPTTALREVKVLVLSLCSLSIARLSCCCCSIVGVVSLRGGWQHSGWSMARFMTGRRRELWSQLRSTFRVQYGHIGPSIVESRFHSQMGINGILVFVSQVFESKKEGNTKLGCLAAMRAKNKIVSLLSLTKQWKKKRMRRLKRKRRKMRQRSK